MQPDLARVKPPIDVCIWILRAAGSQFESYAFRALRLSIRIKAPTVDPADRDVIHIFQARGSRPNCQTENWGIESFRSPAKHAALKGSVLGRTPQVREGLRPGRGRRPTRSASPPVCKVWSRPPAEFPPSPHPYRPTKGLHAPTWWNHMIGRQAPGTISPRQGVPLRLCKCIVHAA